MHKIQYPENKLSRARFCAAFDSAGAQQLTDLEARNVFLGLFTLESQLDVLLRDLDDLLLQFSLFARQISVRALTNCRLHLTSDNSHVHIRHNWRSFRTSTHVRICYFSTMKTFSTITHTVE